jgi:hypothetical protein
MSFQVAGKNWQKMKIRHKFHFDKNVLQHKVFAFYGRGENFPQLRNW